MLVCKNISCIRGGKLLFKDLSFELNEGQAVIVRGSNGSGKTSLLRVVIGLLECFEGNIEWAGEDIHECEEFHSKISYIGHKNALKNQQTVLQNLEFWQSVSGAEIELSEVIEKMGIAKVVDLPCHMLSAGWQRRVSLTRLLINQAPLWIIDEPLSYLDSDAKELIVKLIEEHLNSGGMALLADHGHEYSFGEELHISSFARGGK
jgi:heme exporter protein A